MPSTNRFDAHSRIRRVVAGIVAAAVVLLPALPADASSPHRTDHHRTDLRVMTQNLYLGSSLAPALTATSPTAFVAAVAQIYSTVQYTDFPARAEAIADEIDANHPDLVGLQEVTNWTTTRREPASRL